MKFLPSSDKRNVVLAIQTVSQDCKTPLEGQKVLRITSICALFCDRDRITERLYTSQDESELLNSLWWDIRASDRVFAANVMATMALVWEQSWQLGVLPSVQIDLRHVYGPELWDTQRMWDHGYLPYVPYVQRFDSPCWFGEEHTVRMEPDCVHSRD